MSMLSYFNGVLMLSIFWSLAITMITYAIPIEDRGVIDIYRTKDTMDLNTISSQFQGNMEQQLNVPSGSSAVDLALLSLYSGNIFADLLLNFFFAVPNMLSLLLSAILILFPMDSILATNITIAFSVFVSVIYILGIITFLIVGRTQTGGLY